MRTSSRRARAVLAVVAASLALMAIVAPGAARTPSHHVTIVSDMTPIVYPAGYNSGTFTARGSSLICPSGTVLDTRYASRPNPNPPAYYLVVDKTFTCANGTGTIFFRLWVHGDGLGKESFVWAVLGGTHAYARLRGAGLGSSVLFPDSTGVTNRYTGFLVR
jgi:hypothetical protein